jgi:DNA-binding NtrC family response regulator
VPQLAEHFLQGQAQRDGRPAKRFDDAAMSALLDYDWPGNVRELQNICERAGVLAVNDIIEADLITPWLNRPTPPTVSEPVSGSVDPLEIAVTDRASLEDFERELILRTLKKYDGHRQRTAESLGIGVRTLGLKLRKWKDQELVSPDL